MLIAVVLDRAGLFEVIEQDRLDVQVQVDLVRNRDSAARNLVLPGDAELPAVDPNVVVPLRSVKRPLKVIFGWFSTSKKSALRR